MIPQAKFTMHARLKSQGGIPWLRSVWPMLPWCLLLSPLGWFMMWICWELINMARNKFCFPRCSKAAACENKIRTL